MTVLAPPEVSVVPDLVLYQAGDNISISCIARGFPDPTINWWREDILLTGADWRIIASDDYKLHFFFANVDDEGPYTCSATNSAGTGKFC